MRWKHALAYGLLFTAAVLMVLAIVFIDEAPYLAGFGSASAGFAVALLLRVEKRAKQLRSKE